MTTAAETTRRALPADLPEAWSGAATWTGVAGGVQPWRVEPAQLERIVSPSVEELARIPNGVRLAVETDADRLEITLTTEDSYNDAARRVDLAVDGERVASVEAAGRSELAFDLPGTRARVELWLPHTAPTVLHQVLLHGASVLVPAAPRGPRWTVHGSSISQCNEAESPLGTWPALVAAQNSYELTALGMSGQCHLDPPLAETVGRSAPDLVTLCFGANIYGAATFTERSVLPAMIGFVDHVRRLTPAPIVLLSTITSGPHREDEPNAAGLTQRRLRELLHQGAELLGRDDPLITSIDGTEIITQDEMHLLGDLLHPTPEGYRVMAERLAPRLAAALAEAQGEPISPACL